MARNRVVRVLRALLVLLAVCLVWTLVALLSVRDDVASARTALESARAAGDVDASGPQLEEAEGDLRRVSSRLRAPGPAVVARLPLLGRTVRGIERTATAGLAVVEGTRATLALASSDSAPLVVDGGLDTSRMRALADALDDAARRSRGPVADLRRQPTGLLPAFVEDPVREAKAQLAPLPATFTRTAAAVRALSGVLGADEPRQLLIVLENNAELRGTGGIVTVFAEAVADRGKVDVGPFRDVETVADRPTEVTRVTAPADYERLWGRYLASSTLWKNANMSPDVPTASAVLSEIVDTSIGRRPTAVVWLDVRAIAQVLEATGPATLADGTVLTAANTVQVLLSDAYRTAPDDRLGQKARRGQLRGVADAVIDRILGDSPASPSVLGLSLAEASRGRHLKVWSADPEEQAQLVAGGLAGQVAAGDGGDLASFVVQNFGGGGGEGNKLDYYGRRQVSVTVEVGRELATVRQEVSLRNTAPPRGLPRYVAGFETPGVANALVTLALPRDAALLEFSRAGRAVRTEVLPEGDHQVVLDNAELPPGTTATWVLRYQVPLEDGRYRLTTVPQPLAFDGGLLVEVRPAKGFELRTTDTSAEGTLTDGGYRYSGPFAQGSVVDVRAVAPGLLQRTADRAERFWREPLGG